jgi:hypothetical protein
MGCMGSKPKPEPVRESTQLATKQTQPSRPQTARPGSRQQGSRKSRPSSPSSRAVPSRPVSRQKPRPQSTSGRRQSNSRSGSRQGQRLSSSRPGTAAGRKRRDGIVSEAIFEEPAEDKQIIFDFQSLGTFILNHAINFYHGNNTLFIRQHIGKRIIGSIITGKLNGTGHSTTLMF